MAKAAEKGIDLEFVKTAEKFKGGGTAPSRVAGFYGAVVRLEERGAIWEEPELLLLKARIDYAAGRNVLRTPLARALSGGIEAVLAASTREERDHRLRRFREAFEVIVAYCKGE